MKALSGTGCARARLLLELLPEPPLAPELAVDVVREVPLAAVVALEEMLVVVLVVASTFVFVVLFDVVESAELGSTLEVAVTVCVFAGESADVEDAGVETPLVEDGASRELLAPEEPEPAPAEEPCVVLAVAATVPLVVA